MRVKIKMLQSALGADNHIDSKMYNKGQVYEVSESLAQVFIKGKLADLAQETPAIIGLADPPEEKALSAAPENKAHKQAPKNKGGRPKKK